MTQKNGGVVEINVKDWWLSCIIVTKKRLVWLLNLSLGHNMVDQAKNPECQLIRVFNARLNPCWNMINLVIGTKNCCFYAILQIENLKQVYYCVALA